MKYAFHTKYEIEFSPSSKAFFMTRPPSLLPFVCAFCDAWLYKWLLNFYSSLRVSTFFFSRALDKEQKFRRKCALALNFSFTSWLYLWRPKNINFYYTISFIFRESEKRLLITLLIPLKEYKLNVADARAW